MGKKQRRNGSFVEDEDEEQIAMGFSAVYLWQDPTVTAPIFVSVLVTLISVCYYSILSVFAYTALFVLGTATGIKLYVYLMNNILKKNANDPLAKFEGIDPTISEEKVQQFVTCAAGRVNLAILELRRCFFITDIIDSLKFGLFLWFLTYVGSWFNAMTLIVLSWVALFSVPKIYINNHKSLGPIVDKALGHFEDVKGRISAFLPASKKSVAAEEAKKEE